MLWSTLMANDQKASPVWYEQDGVIYFSVFSDGIMGGNLIRSLEYQGYRLGDEAKVIIRSTNFRPVLGTVTNVAVIKGSNFEELGRNTSKVRAFAAQRKFQTIDTEVISLIRQMFTDSHLSDMGLLWMVGMHEPVEVYGEPRLLGLHRVEGSDYRGDFLVSFRGQDSATWDRDTGFVFKVSSQALKLT